ncbi:unnamed protein product [Brassica napus]|uniref:(rape) hypothetical protein n=1 Tax=Brassica napus TaxID=3708 RepID=A0A816Q845_BRANA|nr:unnamed protein product [Brassica napus]
MMPVTVNVNLFATHMPNTSPALTYAACYNTSWILRLHATDLIISFHSSDGLGDEFVSVLCSVTDSPSTSLVFCHRGNICLCSCVHIGKVLFYKQTYLTKENAEQVLCSYRQGTIEDLFDENEDVQKKNKYFRSDKM